MIQFTKQEVDNILPKTATWFKGFTPPSNPSDVVKVFSRLSKRKKLLTLIMLTDQENDRFPEILTSFYRYAGNYAWYALNWILSDRHRVSQLLENVHINNDARAAIHTAVAAGRCVDEISKILNADNCKRSSLVIAQYGSLKQRISLVQAMTATDAASLVCQSNPDFAMRCIDWAQIIGV